jgi:hypothetical protein
MYVRNWNKTLETDQNVVNHIITARVVYVWLVLGFEWARDLPTRRNPRQVRCRINRCVRVSSVRSACIGSKDEFVSLLHKVWIYAGACGSGGC